MIYYKRGFIFNIKLSGEKFEIFLYIVFFTTLSLYFDFIKLILF